MKKYLFLLLVILAVNAYGQGPQVPSTMDFAGMKLHLNDAARKQIQADVDNLRRNEQYFRRRMEKVDLHFPVIEKVFREENLPDDFKYLVIQESALVSDAVSSSNAVGFWQFKKETGLEMGLRIDHEVDERLNLVSSSRAAAGYLKKNNFYYDNWIYALLAYNTGRGGAQKYVNERNFGKRKMDITGNTHWYVKKFLAHKIAYENELRKSQSALALLEYNDGAGKSLKDIAREFDVDHDLLAEYNKCFKRKRVPDDKSYCVIVPVGADETGLLAANAEKQNTTASSGSSAKVIGTYVKEYYSEAGRFPVIKNTDDQGIFSINGKDGTIAKPGDNFDELALRGGISVDRFYKFNDLTDFDKAKPGTVYYYKRKNSKAKTHYHTLMPGETLWEVSQKYGIKLKKLLAKNRLDSENEAKAGLVLWLRYIRPRNVPAEYHNVEPPVKKEAEMTASETPKATVNPQPPAESRPKKPYLVEDPEDNEDYLFADEPAGTPVPSTPPQAPLEISGNKEDVIREHNFEDKTESAPLPAYEIVTHEVEKGETFFSISRRYAVDVSDLLSWNNLQINDVLSIGQKLTIKQSGNRAENTAPVTTPQKPDNLIIHQVTDDDTLYGIAKKYQVTIKDIMEWNAKENFVIQSGEELKIFTQ